MTGGPTTPWSDEQRAEAMALYVQVGAAAASRATGVPSGTITSWASRTPGMQAAHADNQEQLAAALQAKTLQWQARKLDLIDQFAALADTALALAHDNAESGNMRNLKDAITTAAIAVDKAQLLSGGATGRIEHSDADGELAAEVARLVEERRAVAAGAVPLDSRRTA